MSVPKHLLITANSPGEIAGRVQFRTPRSFLYRAGYNPLPQGRHREHGFGRDQVVIEKSVHINAPMPATSEVSDRSIPRTR